MKRALFVLLLLLIAPVAHATMPELPDRPSVISPETCLKWAHRQNDEEVLAIWGINEDGTTSNQTAMNRLVDECLGKPMPEIVGFGTSAGFEEDYCGRHPTFGVCKKYLLSSQQASTSSADNAQPPQGPAPAAAPEQTPSEADEAYKRLLFEQISQQRSYPTSSTSHGPAFVVVNFGSTKGAVS